MLFRSSDLGDESQSGLVDTGKEENGRFVKLDMDEMDLRRFLNERLFISSGD